MTGGDVSGDDVSAVGAVSVLVMAQRIGPPAATAPDVPCEFPVRRGVLEVEDDIDGGRPPQAQEVRGADVGGVFDPPARLKSFVLLVATS